MRIKSQKVKDEERERKNRIIMSIFITVIMVGSILGIFVYKDDLENIQTYKAPDGKKYDFVTARSQVGLYGYSTEIGKSNVFFFNYPETVTGSINISSDVKNILDSQVFYFLFDPEDEELDFIDLTRFDIVNEYSKSNRYVISSKIKNSTNYELYPIIDCVNATQFTPVFKFVSSNQTKISNDDYCVTFEGRQYDFLIYRDLLIYKLYGLI